MAREYTINMLPIIKLRLSAPNGPYVGNIPGSVIGDPFEDLEWCVKEIERGREGQAQLKLANLEIKKLCAHIQKLESR